MTEEIMIKAKPVMQLLVNADGRYMVAVSEDHITTVGKAWECISVLIATCVKKYGTDEKAKSRVLKAGAVPELKEV